MVSNDAPYLKQLNPLVRHQTQISSPILALALQISSLKYIVSRGEMFFFNGSGTFFGARDLIRSRKVMFWGVEQSLKVAPANSNFDHL